MDKQKITQDNYSLCYSCEYARKPAADENTEKGYVGCAIPVIVRQRTDADHYDYDFVSEGEELAEGWVDLRAEIFSESSGVISNGILLTRGIIRCQEYKDRLD